MEAVIDLRDESHRVRKFLVNVPDPEVNARATSGTTVDVVDRRLTELSGMTDADSISEVAYLRGVRARLVGGA